VRIVLDPRARLLDGGRTLVGGDPWRVMRLTEGGAAVLRELLAGQPPEPGEPGEPGETREARGAPAESGSADALTRRLIDSGLAHPRPRQAPCGAVTVVIPVRDRPRELARCLSALLATDPPGRVIVVDDGSSDRDAVAAVCREAGCELIRRERSGGPASARNAALETVESGLVALLDSDCVPEPGWLSLLCGTLAADPGLGAVAPRVRPLGGGGDRGEPSSGSGRERFPASPCSGSGRERFPASPSTGALARFAAVRSPLDLGPWPSLVRPGGRVAYVPTAALLARREALGSQAPPFDPELRYGEDVDLVWRMLDHGWPVRYEPAAVVGHGEPERLRPWLGRRFRYGSSAGPLALRHPERLAPVAIHPRSAAVLGTAALATSSVRVPGSVAAVAALLHVLAVSRSLSQHGVPPRTAAVLGLQGLGESAAALGRAATMLAPAPLAAALVRPRTRKPALALLLAAPIRDYVRLRPSLDPLRFAGLCVADDVSYGAGVWAGSVRSRTSRALRPRIVSGKFLRSSGRPWRPHNRIRL
jgi:GT2 family glycosyltransferase